MESNVENLSLIAHLRKFCAEQSSHKNFNLRNHFLVAGWLNRSSAIRLASEGVRQRLEPSLTRLASLRRRSQRCYTSLRLGALNALGSAFGGAEMCTSALTSSRGRRGRWNGREKAAQK
jgi:hypothetical protein